MELRKNYWLVLIPFFNWLVAAAVFGEWQAPVRGYIVFAFLLFCPGLALAYLLPTRDALTCLFLVIVLSIGIDTVVAELILYLGEWSPQLILVILIGVCLLGVLVELAAKIRYVQFSPRQ